MADAVTFDVDLKGRAFNGELEAAVQRRLEEAKIAVAEHGADVIRRRVKHKLKDSTGAFPQAIQAIKTKHKGVKVGVIWPKVLQGPWLEGVDSRNDPERFRGYFTFRQSHAAVDRAAQRITAKIIRRALR
jgi:hypothetical protein